MVAINPRCIRCGVAFGYGEEYAEVSDYVTDDMIEGDRYCIACEAAVKEHACPTCNESRPSADYVCCKESDTFEVTFSKDDLLNIVGLCRQWETSRGPSSGMRYPGQKEHAQQVSDLQKRMQLILFGDENMVPVQEKDLEARHAFNRDHGYPRNGKSCRLVKFRNLISLVELFDDDEREWPYGVEVLDKKGRMLTLCLIDAQDVADIEETEYEVVDHAPAEVARYFDEQW